MALKIFKYELTAADKQTLTLPVIKVLSVGFQPGKLCLWALVDPESVLKQVEVEIVGTGHDKEPVEGQEFLGTVFDHPFVWHVFYRVV
jgi:hypothetical protein